MAFLIRTIDHTAAGREIVRERTIEQPNFTIGRASENAIHLPDLAIEQHHVEVRQDTDGNLSLEAIGTLGFRIDGRNADFAKIDPSHGAELQLGSAILTFAAEPGGTTGITVRKVETDEAKSDAVRGFALDSALTSKRAISWITSLIILIALLAVPVYSHLARDRVAPDADEPGQVLLDSAWSTGPLSLAHRGLADNCEACHVDAFVSVRDETCLTCHAELGEHAPPPRLAGGRAPFSYGDALQWQVAEFFGKEGPGACTTCHTEHEGPTRMEPASQKFCADCHSKLDTRLTDTSIGNASDFGELHPQFRPAFYTKFGQEKPVRMSLADNLKEENGLKFPHDLHLNRTGGVARMATKLGKQAGYGAPLECSNCHTEDANGIGFKPVEMETACENCHSLVFDRVGGIFRKLPHGDVDQARANLLAMDRTPRKPLVTGRRRPGMFAKGEAYFSNFGPPRPELAGTNQPLGPGGVCRECHLPANIGGRPDVVPIKIPDRYLFHGYFDHAAHDQEKCSSCHKAGTSSSSSDLLLPGIAVCRDCHLGEDAIRAEVPSNCAMCHSYHTPSGPAPLDHPRDRRDFTAMINPLRLRNGE